MRDRVIAGPGIALLPTFIVGELHPGSLFDVLDEYAPAAMAIYTV